MPKRSKIAGGLPARLKALRHARGLTQAEVATAIDVSRSTLANIEAGISLPGRECLFALARFFEVPVDTMQTGDAPADDGDQTTTAAPELDNGTDLTITTRIRDARKARGLTQEELAKIVGVPPGAVAQWEGGGDRHGISSPNLLKLAQALRVSSSYLLGEDGKASAWTVVDPEEREWLRQYRAMPLRLRKAHLRLLQEQASLRADEQASP